MKLLPLLPLFFVSHFAANAQFTYTTNSDGSLNIYQYTGSGGVVVVPDSTNGLPITSIGTNAFRNYASLTSVTTGTNVTTIGNSAFDSCGSLTNVVIGTNVTSMGDYTFHYCSNLVYVTIGNSVTNVGLQAFYNCTHLSSVTIPNSVSSIGGYAFYSCTNLTNVVFGYGVASIGYQAFIYCTHLTSLTISNNITNFGQNAFAECTNLTSVTIGNNSAIINGATLIPPMAFGDCLRLSRVILLNSVTSITSDAFADCPNLHSITIPASVTNISNYAFDSCINLASVYFEGNAPGANPAMFGFFHPIIYYLPGTTGWDSTFIGLTTVLWNPRAQTNDGSFGLNSNQFGFNITASTNFSVAVEACTNLGNPIWTPLKTVTLTNGLFYFSDAQWANYPVRFYRLHMP